MIKNISNLTEWISEKDMIKVENINFSYAECSDVLNNVSFSVTKGERVGVVGPNGAGKTTLFHLICGILKPDSGGIYINKKPVLPKTFNPDIGFVFQNPDDQLFNATVYDDVAFGPYNLGLDKVDVNSQVESVLEVTGTTEFRDRPPHHLSGGEKRMVAIATVLAMKPEVIIYDEPTSNLDMRARRKLISFINSGNETKLIASHDLEFILETCHSVIIIDNGKIIKEGPSHKIMNDKGFMMEHGLERPHSLLHKTEHIHDL